MENVKSVVVPTLEASLEGLLRRLRSRIPCVIRLSGISPSRSRVQGTLVGESGVLINSSSDERGAGRGTLMVRVGGSVGNSLGRRAPGLVLKATTFERVALRKCLICVPLNSWRGSVKEYLPSSPGARLLGSTVTVRVSVEPPERRFSSSSSERLLSGSREMLRTRPPITARESFSIGSSSKIWASVEAAGVALFSCSRPARFCAAGRKKRK